MSGLSVRRTLYQCLWSGALKSRLERVPVLRRIYAGWSRSHPFDRSHGIDTSGFIPASECANGDLPAAQINFYSGSQPSIVRAALASLPEHARYAFVDIGCGKGRPLVVASEFGFERVLGVELAPHIAHIARTNAAAIAAQHPDRTPIKILVGDATTVLPPVTTGSTVDTRPSSDGRSGATTPMTPIDSGMLKSKCGPATGLCDASSA